MEQAVRDTVDTLSQRMNEIRIDGPKNSALKTALVLELNSFKSPEPSEEAAAQVEKVLTKRFGGSHIAHTKIQSGTSYIACKLRILSIFFAIFHFYFSNTYLCFI